MLRQSIVLFKKINEASMAGDTEFMAANSTDDVQWNIVGSKTIQGKNELLKEMKARRMKNAADITYSYFITHGNKAAINGAMSIAGKQYAFCHIYSIKSEIFAFKAKKICKRIERITRIQPFALSAIFENPLTVSFGVTAWPRCELNKFKNGQVKIVTSYIIKTTHPFI